MSRRRRRVPTTPMITVTSMMDMFTIILVFLLNFLDPTQDASAGVTLPSSKSTEAPGEAVTLTVSTEAVSIDGARVATVNGTELPDAVREALTQALKSAHAEHAGDTLRVAADKAVPYRVLAAALRAAGEAGFGEFRFVVVSEPDTKP